MRHESACGSASSSRVPLPSSLSPVIRAPSALSYPLPSLHWTGHHSKQRMGMDSLSWRQGPQKTRVAQAQLAVQMAPLVVELAGGGYDGCDLTHRADLA